MRFIRLLFVICLGLILIIIAAANREIVELSAFPANFDRYLGGDWSIQMPLFLIIMLSIVLGVLIGFIWEYLREAHLRRESRQRASQVAQLEREVGNLRESHAAPRDDVLAIVERKPGTAQPASGAALPRPAGR